MGVAEVAALIAALSQTGLNIFAAVQTANALNTKPEPTAADFAALEAAMTAALDQSALVHASIAAARAVALAGAKAVP